MVANGIKSTGIIVVSMTLMILLLLNAALVTVDLDFVRKLKLRKILEVIAALGTGLIKTLVLREDMTITIFKLYNAVLVSASM